MITLLDKRDRVPVTNLLNRRWVPVVDRRDTISVAYLLDRRNRVPVTNLLDRRNGVPATYSLRLKRWSSNNKSLGY